MFNVIILTPFAKNSQTHKEKVKRQCRRDFYDVQFSKIYNCKHFISLILFRMANKRLPRKVLPGTNSIWLEKHNMIIIQNVANICFVFLLEFFFFSSLSLRKTRKSHLEFFKELIYCTIILKFLIVFAYSILVLQSPTILRFIVEVTLHIERFYFLSKLPLLAP